MQTFALWSVDAQYGIYPDRTDSVFVASLFENGVVQEVPTPRLNWRDRGQHDPGSGEYQNRWVFANEVKCQVNGQQNPIPCSFASSWDGGGTPPRSQLLQGSSSWDGFRLVQVALRVWYSTDGQPQYYLVNDKLACFGEFIKTTMWPPWRCVRKYSSETKQFSYTNEGYEQAQARYAARLAYASRPYEMWDLPSSWMVMNLQDGFIRPDSEPKFSDYPSQYKDAIDLGIGVGRGFNALIANAYVDMVSKLPDASGMSNAVNAIQLTTAGLKAIWGATHGDFSKFEIGTLGDAWLAYRYSYGTTKADLEEAASLLSRASDLLFVDNIRCYGQASQEVGDGDILVARCSMELEKSVLAGLKSTIERYGLQMDAYAMWDLVPYSFVADWFLGVGDQLEYARSKNFARRIKDRSCWCSIERRWTNEYGFPEIYYHRWYGHPDVSQATMQQHDASGATIVKRALDVLALLA